MKRMFIKHFGLIDGQNEEESIHLRNPINTPVKFRNNLPLLIMQKRDNLREPLESGYSMVETLKKTGHHNTDLSSVMDSILDWFEL